MKAIRCREISVFSLIADGVYLFSHALRGEFYPSMQNKRVREPVGYSPLSANRWALVEVL